MKKIIIFLLCLTFVFLCSCSSEYSYSVDGYENFKTSHSHYELNHYILPTIDFADIYQPTEIDYYCREEYESMLHFVERTFLVISYENETYEQAKEYCLQNMQLSDADPLAYNGYTFIENIELAVKQDRLGKPSSFPCWFNMFAYNDRLNRLVFIGFYGSDYSSDDAENVRSNWGFFIEKHFSDLYDWG